MPRLAWFSPVPPVRSGIAAVTADVVTALADEHGIDLYVDDAVPRSGSGVRSAHEFVPAHHLAPYDLTVYQVGNSSSHDYLVPYLFHFPGLAVLHDTRLHHARAGALLRRGQRREYRDEFTWNHPEADADLAELAVAGFDSPLYYDWPMTRLIACASRAVAVHTRAARDELARSAPEVAVQTIRLGHGAVARSEEAAAEARRRGRLRLGIPPDALVFGCYGALTPEKRLPQIVAAFADTLRYTPSARLLLGGRAAEHYDLEAGLARHGVLAQTIVSGYVPTDEEFTDAVAACDVGLALRWPTAGEVSGPWLRCLALGKPTITLDVGHMADVPSLDPRTWTPQGDAAASPVCVAVDLLDEDHSLRLAMRRLAKDRALRDRLGAAGQAYWQREHTVESMVDDYRRLIAEAIARPIPDTGLPAHLTADGTALVRTVLGRFGIASPVG